MIWRRSGVTFDGFSAAGSAALGAGASFGAAALASAFGAAFGFASDLAEEFNVKDFVLQLHFSGLTLKA